VPLHELKSPFELVDQQSREHKRQTHPEREEEEQKSPLDRSAREGRFEERSPQQDPHARRPDERKGRTEHDRPGETQTAKPFRIHSYAPNIRKAGKPQGAYVVEPEENQKASGKYLHCSPGKAASQKSRKNAQRDEDQCESEKKAQRIFCRPPRLRLSGGEIGHIGRQKRQNTGG